MRGETRLGKCARRSMAHRHRRLSPLIRPRCARPPSPATGERSRAVFLNHPTTTGFCGWNQRPSCLRARERARISNPLKIGPVPSRGEGVLGPGPGRAAGRDRSGGWPGDRSSQRIVDDCGPLSGWRLGLWRSGWGDAGVFAGLKPRSPEGPETLRPPWASVGKGSKRRKGSGSERHKPDRSHETRVRLLKSTDRDGASARAEKHLRSPQRESRGPHRFRATAQAPSLPHPVHSGRAMRRACVAPPRHRTMMTRMPRLS